MDNEYEEIHEEYVHLCRKGLKHSLKLLINEGIDLNYKNDEAMISACDMDRHDVIVLLYETERFKNVDLYVEHLLHDPIKAITDKSLFYFFEQGFRFEPKHKKFTSYLFYLTDELIRYIFDNYDLNEISDVVKCMTIYYNINKNPSLELFDGYLDTMDKDHLIEFVSGNCRYNEILVKCINLIDSDEYQKIIENIFSRSINYTNIIINTSTLYALKNLGFIASDEIIIKFLNRVQASVSSLCLSLSECEYEKYFDYIRLVTTDESIKSLINIISNRIKAEQRKWVWEN